MMFYVKEYRFYCGIDLYVRENIPFVLDRALYMKAIRGG